MYGYIYKTTNLVNSKIYIGQKKSDMFVGNQYLGSGARLNNAIQHYGKENFTVELVEWCESRAELNDKEKYWIQYFRESGMILYNISAGGDGGDTFTGQTPERKAEITKKTQATCAKRTPEERSMITKKRNSTMLERGTRSGPKGGNIPWNKDKTAATDERVAKSAQAAQATRKSRPPVRWKKNPEGVERTRQFNIGNKYGLGNKSTKGCKLMYRDGINTAVKPEDIETYLAEGWQFGQLKKRQETYYNSVGVHCVTTADTYASLAEASRKTGISSYYIQKSCVQHVTVSSDNLLFEFVF